MNCFNKYIYLCIGGSKEVWSEGDANVYDDKRRGGKEDGRC